jgi:hypothetical protein
MPIVQLFRKHALLVFIAALVFAGNNAVGYMATSRYIQRYATNPDGQIGLATVGLGLTYGLQAAQYAELFPASIRFSGVSISYAIGAILGGVFAPTIAEALVTVTGTTMSVTWYLAGMTVVGLVATLLLRDRSGIPLGPDHEAEQEISPLRGLANV